ncbi:MAG: DUF4142 domain-containing protein [Candidatus Eremiobacteraeota bacterium]|nr:DUF4142 domain-containing protein [Candidatus Eremiobacteraeota bacterium]
MLGVFAAFTACGSNDNPTYAAGPGPTTAPLTQTDITFMTSATQYSNGEIAAGQLAVSKSQNADVLAFAREMVANHTTEKQALAPIATSLGVALPTTIAPAQQPAAALLMVLTGTAFDKEYIDSEVQGHTANLTQNYEPEVADGSSPPVVGYAKTYEPQIQMHLTMAQSIAQKYGF